MLTVYEVHKYNSVCSGDDFLPGNHYCLWGDTDFVPGNYKCVCGGVGLAPDNHDCVLV